MLSPFQSPKMLISNAKNHLCRFRNEIDVFIPKNIGIKINSEENSGKIFYKKKFEPINDQLPVIAYDIIQNLRSALDHVILDAVVLNAPPDTIKDAVRRNIKFPWINSESDKNGGREWESRAKNIPEKIKDICAKFEPYKGGKYSIWELNTLRNNKIHQTLELFAAKSKDITITDSTVIGAVVHFSDNLDRWDAESRELTYMSVSSLMAGSKYDLNVKIDLIVTLDSKLFPKRECAIELLEELCKTVEKIVETIEQDAT